MAAEQDETACS